MEEPAGTALERLAKELGAFLPRNENSANITINAGGIGVVIAAACCFAMLCVALVVGPILYARMTALEAAYKEEDKKIQDDVDANKAWIQVLNNNKQDKGKN